MDNLVAGSNTESSSNVPKENTSILYLICFLDNRFTGNPVFNL